MSNIPKPERVYGLMVIFIKTLGSRSMDIYSQKLAENLDVPIISTDIYSRVARSFNIPLISRESLRNALKDLSFIKMLNELNSIVHLPNHHLGRYGCFLKKPFIITVHDLIRFFDLKGYSLFIHKPNLRDRIYLELDYRGIRKAKKIIAVSHCTRKDLIMHLGVPEDRIEVIYEGVDHKIFKPSRSRRPIDNPYVLYVGSEQPRKNIHTLLKAFKRVKEKREFEDLKLVKVGGAGGADFRKSTNDMINLLKLQEDVIFTGFVPTELLPAYYSHAECLVLPSFYEGFGLPCVEAMACGCPVIASNTSSLPEIVGDAGLMVNPRSVDDLAEALHRLLTDDGLRQEMISRGLKRAAEFSWEKTARETRKVYEDVEGV